MTMCKERGFVYLCLLVCLLLLVAPASYSDVVLTDAEVEELEAAINTLQTESARLSESLERASDELQTLRNALTASKTSLNIATISLTGLEQQARRQEQYLRRLRAVAIAEAVVIAIVTVWAVMR